MKRCSTSSVTRQIQTKTTMGYHFTPSGMAIIIKQNKQTNKTHNQETISVGKNVEKLEASYTYWWECKMVDPLWKWFGVSPINVQLPYDSAILLLGT